MMKMIIISISLNESNKKKKYIFWESTSNK